MAVTVTVTDSNEVPEVSVDDAMADYEGRLREKILFGLKVYPFISPTMLHNFLGTSTPARLWKSILQELVEQGQIQRTEVQLTSPHDRVQTYSVLHLTENPYPHPYPNTNGNDTNDTTNEGPSTSSID